LALTSLGGDLYRLEWTPLLVEQELFPGDVIEAETQENESELSVGWLRFLPGITGHRFKEKVSKLNSEVSNVEREESEVQDVSDETGSS